MKSGFIPIVNINKGMQAILNGKYAAIYPKAQEIIEYGMYYKYLHLYSELFDKSQIQVVLFDDLKKEPLKELKKIFKFLEVDDSYIPKSLDKRPQKGIYSLFRLKVRTLRNSIIYEYNETRTRLQLKKISIFEKIMNEVILFFDKNIFQKICNNSKPVLDEQISKALYNIYSQEVENLEKLLNRDLQDWKD